MWWEYEVVCGDGAFTTISRDEADRVFDWYVHECQNPKMASWGKTVTLFYRGNPRGQQTILKTFTPGK